jgi:GTP-binding protein EngB required for normal cell division
MPKQRRPPETAVRSRNMSLLLSRMRTPTKPQTTNDDDDDDDYDNPHTSEFSSYPVQYHPGHRWGPRRWDPSQPGPTPLRPTPPGPRPPGPVVHGLNRCILQSQNFKMSRINLSLPTSYIFLGNPGTGKSTLCNSLMGSSEFKAGISFGSGLTTALQLTRLPGAGDRWVGDSPGLADPDIRERAAQEITKLLKSGEGEYKIMFVVTLQAGRVNPEDNVTMKLVLDAIGQPNGQAPRYGIIVNKLSKVLRGRLNDPTGIEYQRVLATLNVGRDNPTPYILFYPQLEQLEDGENIVHAPQPELLMFLRLLPSVHLEPRDVQDVAPSEYDKLKEDFKRQFDRLYVTNGRLREKLNQSQYATEQEMDDVRKMALEMMNKLKEMAQANADAKQALMILEARLKKAEEEGNPLHHPSLETLFRTVASAMTMLTSLGGLKLLFDD